MAPVARELSAFCGILEPLQTASSIEGQIRELHGVLEKHGRLPVTLIGHSWGAWLGLIFAARYPACVKKLMLIGCPSLDVKDAIGIMETRLSRLSGEERKMVHDLVSILDDDRMINKAGAFARFGKLMAKADTLDPLQENDDEGGLGFREDIYQSVWREAEGMRRTGELSRLAGRVECPVVAIHGDYDSHTAAVAEASLRGAIRDFRFKLLKGCGHEPWRERGARERFFTILREELA